MNFNNLPLAERKERAQFVHSTNIYVPCYTKKYLKRHPEEAKAQIREYFSTLPHLTNFFQAALLVRKNYSEWKMYLKKPTGSIPKAFKSFAKDRLLVFYLFLVDYLDIFHLNPALPFVSDEKLNSRVTVIRGKKDDILSNVKYVVKMWEAMGSPWKESRCGRDFGSLAEAFSQPNFRKEDRDDLCIAWHFWEISTQFNSYWFLIPKNGTIENVEEIHLDHLTLIDSVAAALAFDHSGVNTLEVVHELFPQIPGLMESIIQMYILRPIHFTKFKGPEKAMFRDIVLQEMFNCELDPASDGPLPSLALAHENCKNRSIVQLFKRYPKLSESVNDYQSFCDILTTSNSKNNGEKMDRLFSNVYERESTPLKYKGRKKNKAIYIPNESHHIYKKTFKDIYPSKF